MTRTHIALIVAGLMVSACASGPAPAPAGGARHAGAPPHSDAGLPTIELPGAANPHWTRDLPRLMPAVEQCFARAGAAVRVTHIVEIAGGRHRIRVRERGGAGYDCIAESGDGPVSLFARLGPEEPPGNEERTHFSPPGMTRPEGPCFEHQRAVDDGGRVLGTLSTNVC